MFASRFATPPQNPPSALLRNQNPNTSHSLLADCWFTHSIVAGSVDNVNLLEIPIKEVSAYSKDIAATAIVLLHRH